MDNKFYLRDVEKYRRKYWREKRGKLTWRMTIKSAFIIFVIGLALFLFLYAMAETARSDKKIGLSKERFVFNQYNFQGIFQQGEEKEILPKHYYGQGSFYDYDLERADQKCKSDTCYSMFNDTCASRDYPRGTILSVRRLDTGKQITCRCNDVGPDGQIFPERIIDLSSHAFAKLADLSLGVIEVEVWEDL